MSEFWLKVDKTLRYHGRQIVRRARDIRWSVARPEMGPPVFIVGCSRAGTTVVYKTFSESPVLGTLQRETHDFWAELHPLAERNWDTHALSAQDVRADEREIVQRYFYKFTGRRRFVDKNNQNGLCIPYLYKMFPEAYFIYVKRSPGDNINSLIEGWDKPEEFATWSGQLPAKVQVENGKFTQWCFFLMEGWRELLSSPVEDVCARQYVAINEAILQGRNIIPEKQWTEIRYEDLLKDPVEGFRQAFTRIGLEFTPDLKKHCETVLSTPYNAFSEIRLDKWRDSKHRAKIERVMPTVADVARRMDYQL